MGLSFLDQPEILEAIFPVVYSPFFPANCHTFSSFRGLSYSIQVGEDIVINCGFWVSGKGNPSMLYFHGNGETVGAYDCIAPYYNQIGINLFVADYRGYGTSDGKPTVSNMFSDANAIFKSFREVIEKEGFRNSLFVMGRSLGSMPAIEAAFNHQEEICRLIIESGTASNLRCLWNCMETTENKAVLNEESLFLNKVKIRQIHKPTLIMHGEYDQIVPVEEGRELYQNSGTQDKQILIVPGADHNDIMLVDQNLYFEKIEKFVQAYG